MHSHHDGRDALATVPDDGAPIDLEARWADARTIEQFVAGARSNAVLWNDMTRRARAPMDAVARGRALPASRRLLVLLEDWCGDAVNTIPMIASLVQQVPQLDLRVLARDEHPDVMDRHLSGGARAIPVVIVLDAQWRELGWWGSRPQPLQAWAMSAEARAMSSADRYREIRRWYARDRGLTTLDEVLTLLERTTDVSTRRLDSQEPTEASASASGKARQPTLASLTGEGLGDDEISSTVTWTEATATHAPAPPSRPRHRHRPERHAVDARRRGRAL
jgi:hypothetical protein